MSEIEQISLSIQIVHFCASLFTGTLPDNWWRRRPQLMALLKGFGLGAEAIARSYSSFV